MEEMQREPSGERASSGRRLPRCRASDRKACAIAARSTWQLLELPQPDEQDERRAIVAADARRARHARATGRGRSKGCTRRRSKPPCGRRSPIGLVDDLDWLRRPRPVPRSTSSPRRSRRRPRAARARAARRSRASSRATPRPSRRWRRAWRWRPARGSAAPPCARASRSSTELPDRRSASPTDRSRSRSCRGASSRASGSRQPSTARSRRARLARIFERAAREAARRAPQGDDHALRVFRATRVAQALEPPPRRPRVARVAPRRRRARAPRAVGRARWRKAVEDGLSPEAHADRVAARGDVARRAVAVAPRERSGSSTSGMTLRRRPARRKIPAARRRFVWGSRARRRPSREAAASCSTQLVERAHAGRGGRRRAARRATERSGPLRASHRASRRRSAILRRREEARGRRAADDGAEALVASRCAREHVGAEPRDDEPLRVQVVARARRRSRRKARARRTRTRGSLRDASRGLARRARGGRRRRRRGRAGSSRAAHVARGAARSRHSLLERDVARRSALRLGARRRRAKADEDAASAAARRVAEWILERFREREATTERGRAAHADALAAPPPRAAPPRRRRHRRRRAVARAEQPAQALVAHRARSLLDRLRERSSARRCAVRCGRCRARSTRSSGSARATRGRAPRGRAAVGRSRRVRRSPKRRWIPTRHVLMRSRAARRPRPRPNAEAMRSAALDALDARVRLLDPSNRAEALRTVLVRSVERRPRVICRGAALRELAARRHRAVRPWRREASLAPRASGTGRARRGSTRSRPAPRAPSTQLARRPCRRARPLRGRGRARRARHRRGARRRLVTRRRRSAPVASAQARRLRSRAAPATSRRPSLARRHVTEAAPRVAPGAPDHRRLLRLRRPRRAARSASVFVVDARRGPARPDAERSRSRSRVLGDRRAQRVGGGVLQDVPRRGVSASSRCPPHPNLARFVTFDAGAAEADPRHGARRGGDARARHSRRALDMRRAPSARSTTSSPGSRRCTPWASGTSISSRRTSSCGGRGGRPRRLSASPGATSVRAARPARTARPRCGARRRRVAGVAPAGRHLRVRLRRVRDAHRATSLRRRQRDRADHDARRARRLPGEAPRAREASPRSSRSPSFFFRRCDAIRTSARPSQLRASSAASRPRSRPRSGRSAD